MAVPSTGQQVEVPNQPNLGGGDAGRSENSIRVQWTQISGADKYVVRSVWTDGSREETVAGTDYTFRELTPNRSYSISFRAVSNPAGPGPWSAELWTCTRPPTPKAPKQLHGDMIDIEAGNFLTWDVIGDLAVVDEPNTIGVVLAREDLLGSMIPVSPDTPALALKHSDSYRDPLSGPRTYRLQMISPNLHTPGGVNRSAWGARATTVQIYFGELRVPGSNETRVVSQDLLRDYYG